MPERGRDPRAGAAGPAVVIAHLDRKTEPLRLEQRKINMSCQASVPN